MRSQLHLALSAVSVLAAAVTALAITPAASAAPLDYAALGDSHAAGTGAGRYVSSGGCDRSQNAYAHWFAAHKRANLVFRACSGATTGDITAQASVLNSGTDLVTVQIGGNDVGFTSVLLACKTGDDRVCDRAVTTATTAMHGPLNGQLDRAYRAIRSKAPNARVAVVGYPRLFELGSCGTEMSQHKRSRLNQAADTLASVTANRAAAAGFSFIDTRGVFHGHGVCGSDAWVHGMRSPVNESYHPSVHGQIEGYYPTVRAAL